MPFIPVFILPRWRSQSQQPKAIFRKSMLNCMLICIQCEAFNVVRFGKLQKQCNNNKHQRQHFHPDWLAVIVELSSRLLWLQTELAEPISRKLQSKRTISFLLCYLKRKSCPTTGGSKWRWNRPKRRLFTSRCLCLWEENVNRNPKVKKRRKGKMEKINLRHHCSFLKHLTTNHYAVTAID